MSRAERKRDHIKHALSTSSELRNLFDDIRLVHRALPDIGIGDIDLTAETGDLQLKSPVFINAMTGGGGQETERINRLLARVAKKTGIAMAVGSQMAALKDEQEIASYAGVREENPDGIIFANLGSEATVRQARQAIDMIGANAIQIHLNVIQELTMPEGDRDFTGALGRIEAIAEAVDIPVIVKETGFGISAEAAAKLARINIAALDISGCGGTNFAAVENERRQRKLAFFQSWGVPTPAAIIETKSVFERPILASGGIRGSEDVLKSLLLGANACGLAGSFLRTAIEDGEEALIMEVVDLHDDLRLMMTALGAKTVPEIKKCPAILSGELHHYLTMRGFDASIYAKERKN